MDIKFHTTPDTLKLVDGEVPYTVSIVFPPYYFNKKMVLVITPYLMSNDGENEIELHSVVIQGEKVQNIDYVIPCKTGGIYCYTDTIPYDEKFKESYLEFRVHAVKENSWKRYSSGAIKVAEGIIIP